MGCGGEGRDLSGNSWMCVGVWWGREDVVVYSGEGGMCVGVVGEGGI